MNRQVNAKPAQISEECQPAEAPALLFEKTMYAVTRPGENGQTEYANVRGFWTANIAEASMGQTLQWVEYWLKEQGKETGAQKSSVTISIYEKTNVPPRVCFGQRADCVVVAQREDAMWRTLVKGSKPQIVTCNPGENEPHYKVTDDRVWQAVTLDATNKDEAFAEVVAKAEMPTTQVKDRLCPQRGRFSVGVRVISIAPV